MYHSTYFDCLHSEFRVLSSLLQKSPHRLKLLLHLPYIISCAENLEDHRRADGYISVQMNYMHNLISLILFSSPEICLVQASLHAVASATKFLLLASSEIWEDFEQFQVALGCDIVVSRKLSQALFTLLGDRLMDPHTHQRLEKEMRLRRNFA